MIKVVTKLKSGNIFVDVIKSLKLYLKTKFTPDIKNQIAAKTDDKNAKGTTT